MPRAAVPAVLVALLFLSTAYGASPADYIVTLRRYDDFHAHEKLIHSILHSTVFSWRFSRRSEYARKAPSDFVVVNTKHPGAVDLLKNTPAVRRVFSSQGGFRAPQAAAPAPPDIPPRSGRQTLGSLHPFSAGELWRRGFTGAGVKVAVFDTGLAPGVASFANVVERTDWTGEGSVSDTVGHGTFVAGLIAGDHPDCPGIAPGVQLYTFRVFTGAQVSYTSWFLDAFNYAMHIGVDVLNLSIGGPDFADAPFTEKVNELTAAGIIVVSAIGNDGPSWGSLNNPGDMLEVVGVGGVEPDGNIASFSSRGMTTHELGMPHRATGRAKPDLVAYARALVGPSHQDTSQCRKLSGTSVASPVVAGAIALIMSAVPEERRRFVANPASVKRALMQSAKLLPGASLFEQGAGVLDIPAAAKAMLEIDAEYLKMQKERADIQASLDRAAAAAAANTVHHLTRTLQAPLSKLRNVSRATGRAEHAPYGAQRILPVHHPALRRHLHAEGADEGASEWAGLAQGPRAYLFPEYVDFSETACPLMWPHCSQPLFFNSEQYTLNITILNPAGVSGNLADVVWHPGTNGDFLKITVTPPQRFWPWSAGLGVHIKVVKAVGKPKMMAEGVLRIVVVTPAEKVYSIVELPLRVELAPTPPKENRILWDMFHSLRYPPGYVPRDSLKEARDMLDWLGDHPHTNYRGLYMSLRKEGYFVDVVDRPISCLGESVGELYGALVIIDSEDFFFEAERRIIRDLVVNDGIALIVAAEWYNTEIMHDIRFEDDNTRSRWTPVTGGGNIQAVNQLLEPFGIGFGSTVVSGDLAIDGHQVRIESGAAITKFPRNGELVTSSLSVQHTKKTGSFGDNPPAPSLQNFPILGLAFFGQGTVVALGDTNSLDGAYKGGGDGHELFLQLLQHAISPPVPRRPLFRGSAVLRHSLNPPLPEEDPLAAAAFALFVPHSRVLAREATVEQLVYRDFRPLCKDYNRLERDPRAGIGAPINDSVTLRLRAHAQLLGSEAHYYASLPVAENQRVARRAAAAAAAASEHTARVAVAWRKGSASFAMLYVLVGAAFMLAAGYRSCCMLRGGRRRRLPEKVQTRSLQSRWVSYIVPRCILQRLNAGGESARSE